MNNKDNNVQIKTVNHKKAINELTKLQKSLDKFNSKKGGK